MNSDITIDVRSLSHCLRWRMVALYIVPKSYVEFSSAHCFAKIFIHTSKKSKDTSIMMAGTGKLVIKSLPYPKEYIE